MGKIHILSNELINQIAAGEIIERPASIVKELIENSIDANSTRINIFIQNAGKTKLVIEDNGDGINKDDLKLAMQRHATSKLSGNNLMGITSYGFRGEALPSIAAISRLELESNGFGITVEFLKENEIIQSTIMNGTRITVKDIFDRLPARLKFLRSDNIELSNCISVIENFALTQPSIEFTLRDNKKTILTFKEKSIEERISQVLGNDLFNRAIYISNSDDILQVEGYLFHPMDSKYSQASQRIFINSRVVKDKTISAAIRNAYKDLIPAGRFAICVLFITINPFYLDVNVSPTKSEIRFRDPNYVQKMVSESIQSNLQKFDKVSISIDNEKLGINTNTMIPGNSLNSNQNFDYTSLPLLDKNNIKFHDNTYNDKPMYNTLYHKSDFIHTDMKEPDFNTKYLDQTIIKEEKNISFFGEPIGQLLNTYIICKTENELVIIDQHAVHEKITMEKMKSNINMNNKQHLMNPIVLNLNNTQLATATEVKAYLLECGFNLDFSENTVSVFAIPSIMTEVNVTVFLMDIFESPDIIHELHIIDTIRLKIATAACHNSIRAGRTLSIDEMKSIIKEMEQTLSIHQCNHHRPSFIKLTKQQLESIFERK